MESEESAGVARVPTSLEAFVTEFLPATFEAAKRSTGVGTYHGHCVVRAGDRCWTLEVHEQRLLVHDGARPGAVGQLELDVADFPKVMGALIEAARGNVAAATAEPFTLSEASASEIRSLPGSILVHVKDDAERHEVHAVFGDQRISPLQSTCRIDLSMAHLRDILSGEQHPLQLMLRGDIRVDGDTSLPTQLAMALLAPET